MEHKQTLGEKIDRYVELRKFASEQKKLGEEIKEDLIAMGAKEFKSPGNNIARITQPLVTSTAWMLAKVMALCPKKLVNIFCPRVVDATEINKWAKANPAAAKWVDKCCKLSTSPGNDRLSVEEYAADASKAA